jgi:hypothetical protein
MPVLVIPPTFKKKLKKKSPRLVGAILECVKRLGDDPHHPGLQTHRVKGTQGVWEAYVDAGNRVTFHYDADGRIELRTHCNHDIIKRNP